MSKWGINNGHMNMSIKGVILIYASIETFNRNIQCGVHTMIHPYLSRRFKTNDRKLWYRRLPIYLFTNTMDSGTVSNHSNNHAQVFTV